VDFSFFNSLDSKPVAPATVQVSVNNGKKQNLKVQPDGTTGVSFKLPDDVSKRILLLEVKNVGYTSRQFIPFPGPENDFDVCFYPEGGHLLPGVPSRVAFKALMSDGRPASVEGVVCDQTGKEVVRLKTQYLGMGSFTINPEKGTSYYAVCSKAHEVQADSTEEAATTQPSKLFELPSKQFEQPSQQFEQPPQQFEQPPQQFEQPSKHFDLPAVQKSGYVLSVNKTKDNFYVSVLQSTLDEHNDTLYLLGHTRGDVQVLEQSDDSRRVFRFSQQLFPSGVLHFVLFDKRLNPVSERLVFVRNDDQAHVSYQTDATGYDARMLVGNRVILTGEDGNPLTGSFSVSVTDDSFVPLDSTTNILTQLLLTSDLRGHIENPAAYFSKEASIATRSLDLLMMTQGWSRYDIAEVAQGNPVLPTIPLELGYQITGRVKRLLSDKPVGQSKVTILSSHVDVFDLTETNDDGRFQYFIGDPPDSTSFVVQAVSKSRNRTIELLVDRDPFAEGPLPSVIPPAETDKKLMEQYVEKVVEISRIEEGMMSRDLPEVTVSARKPLPRSVFRASYVMEEEEIQSLNKTK
jgi:hypothetical protein